MVLKPVVNNGIFTISTGEFTGFLPSTVALYMSFVLSPIDVTNGPCHRVKDPIYVFYLVAVDPCSPASCP